MEITIPDEIATLAESHGVDVETVALEAVIAAVEQAVVRAALEAENVTRRTAIESVAAVLRPTQEAAAE